MTKRKDERRELLKEDEILSGLEQAARYIQREPKKVGIWSGGVIVVLAIFFGLTAFREKARNDSAFALYQAEKILRTDINDENAKLKFESEKAKYEAALVELDQVIATNSGVVKQQAIAYKIMCLTDMGKQEELEKLYSELVNEGGYLKFIGSVGRADMYFANDRFDDALAAYDSLMNDGGAAVHIKELVKYKKAACFKGKGNHDEARRLLKELVDEYEGSEDANKPPILAKAQELLSELEEEKSGDNGGEG